MEYGLVALWMATYLLLLYLGMPIARALLPDLEDFGAGVALPLALSVLFLVVFFVGRLSIQIGLWSGLVLLATLSAAAWYRGFEVDHDAYVRVALVFTTAFAFLIAVRAVDPAAHPVAGEKFLDMSLLQSSLRGTTVPPEDAWFAGETVRYYYGGHLLASLLARITGTTGRFAYNLALSGYYAMLVTAAYGLAGSIAAHRGFAYRRAGVAAAFLVGIASNLQTTFRFGGALLDAAAASLGPLGSPLALLGAGWEAVAGLVIPLPRDRGLAGSVTEFSYWDASRVLEGAITEFPLFAWLNGDLHAHMMSTAFLLTVATVLLQVFVVGAERSRRRMLLTVFGALPALGAVVAVFNTWSFPAVGGLVVLTLALGPDRPKQVLLGDTRTTTADGGSTRPAEWLRSEGRTLAIAVGVSGAVLALGWLFSAPYWLFTASSTGGPALFPNRSTLAELIVAHGAFLALFWLYLYRHSRPSLTSPLAAGLVSLVTIIVATEADVAAIALFVPVILVGWILLSRVRIDTDERAATTVADGSGGPSAPGFETVLMIAAAGLIVLVEFIYLQDPASPERFNTVFKIYMQVWILAAVAAGVVLTRLLSEHHPSLGLTGTHWQHAFVALTALLSVTLSLYAGLALSGHFGLSGDGSTSFGLPPWAIVLGFLFLVGTIGVVALRAVNGGVDSGDRQAGIRLAVGLLIVSAGLVGGLGLVDSYGGGSEPTMDALAFVESDHPAEADAIYWLDGEVSEQPNMASYPGRQYTWENAPASLTGVPTVVGKPPESAYRGPTVFEKRVADVQTIFTGEPAEQRRLLAEYDVELIYVGPNERSAYRDITVDDLDAVRVTEEWPRVTIYQVDQTALEDSA